MTNLFGIELTYSCKRFEDTKGVIRSCKSKDRQHNDQKKRTGNTMTKRKRQATQWPKEKGYISKRWSTKNYPKN
jgi:hypothetical protein